MKVWRESATRKAVKGAGALLTPDLELRFRGHARAERSYGMCRLRFGANRRVVYPRIHRDSFEELRSQIPRWAR
jgi:hypothetical protein